MFQGNSLFASRQSVPAKGGKRKKMPVRAYCSEMEKAMLKDGKIWVGSTNQGTSVMLLPGMANRHGLIAGATGSGKTATLKGLAESFSDAGVPVFLADVKGDLAGMCQPGVPGDKITERMEKVGIERSETFFQSYPVTFWDLYGKNGIQLRTTISEMGPMLLSRVLGLNALQSDILDVAFQIADAENLLLIDTKDLKALLHYVEEHRADYEADYGKISSASVAVIIRSLASLEGAGGDVFFGEPALNITDWFTTDCNGKGMIHILDSVSLIQNGQLYSTFLLWLLSELFEQLPEIGDPEKPRMVFFFDEAHLLFKGASESLLDKISQVVRLIRSKGVGVYFCTQNPSDIPDEVLAQIGNKVQHALHAYTPKEQKAVKAAAQSYRANPSMDTCQTIMELGVGEAVCSFLDADGVPSIAEKITVVPPRSLMGPISEEVRQKMIRESLLSIRYANAVDPDSAYEFLQRKGLKEQAEAEEAAAVREKEKQEAKEAKEREKQEAKEAKEKEKAEAKAEEKAAKEELRAREAAQKAQEKEKQARNKEVQKAAKSVSRTVAGTIGREVGKNIGSSFGSFGKTLGGNVGASLGRGIIGTLFKK